MSTETGKSLSVFRSLKSIDELIAGKDRKFFIKKIFSNKETDYTEFIRKLNSLNNWGETFKTIEEEFGRRNINPSDHQVYRFTDMLFKRFFPD